MGIIRIQANGTMTMLTAMLATKATRKGQRPRSRYFPKCEKSKSGKVSKFSSRRAQNPVMSQPRTTIGPTIGMSTQTPPSRRFIIHFGLLKKSETEAV